MADDAAIPIRVFFDASRLMTRGGAAPTGIDRVDFTYAHMLASAEKVDFRMVVFDAFGARLLNRRAAAEMLAETQRRWQSATSSPASQHAFDRLSQWLSAESGAPRPAIEPPPARLRSHASVVEGLKAMLRGPANAWSSQAALDPAADIPGVYLNSSHGRLYRKSVARWLQHSGLPAVFFVHDLIPIEYPQFNRPREPLRHAARLATISRHAMHVIANSSATRESMLRYFAEHALRLPPITVLPLGVDARARQPMPMPPAHPYFVFLSTIEPRKNHRMLLRLWAEWIKAEGNRAPRLVILGRRGWKNEEVFNMLDQEPLLRKHVVEIGTLSDVQVSRVLCGARALLSPSLAEGYGLPVAEALAIGTPVIASELPAHREVGGDMIEYADARDERSWASLLREYAYDPSKRRQDRIESLGAYRAPDWNTHCSRMLSLVRQSALAA